MKGQEELVKSKDQTDIVKGKRSKRQRPSALYCSLASSSSSGCGVVGSGNSDDGGCEGGEYGSLSSATNSGDAYEGNDEEEEMANCLILLAQGGGPTQPVEKSGPMERFDTQKFPEIATTLTSKAGFYFYECKTCNRTFPSFQALGGHRASHKKPKAIVGQRKETITVSTEYLEEAQFSLNGTPSRPLQVAGKGFHSSKAKIHECSICGLEFTSGQALGGHMRRHRASTSTQVVMSIDANATVDSQHVGIKPRDILCLDLNLPAPEDDSKFHLTSAQQSLVFSAPALVDCHY